METEAMEIDLSRYIGILRRWAQLIVLGTIFAGGVALLVSFVLPPVYEAEADIASVKSFSQISLTPDYKTLSEAQLTQGLDVSGRQKALVAIARTNEIGSAVVKELDSDLSAEEHDLVRLIANVNLSADGDLIRIKVQNQDPQKAAKIANAWARTYADHVNQLYTEIPTSLDQVRVQAGTAWQNYQTAETALNQFVGNNRIDSLSREIAAKQNSISDLYATQRGLDRLLWDARSLRDSLDKDPSVSSNDTGLRLAALLIRANSATLSYLSSSVFDAATLPANWQSAPANQSNLPPTQSSLPPTQSTLPIQVQITSALLSDTTPSNIRQQTDSLIAVLEARRRQAELQLADPAPQLQILALQREMEQQTAKKQELTTARDLAWSAYKTMASKIEEVRMAQQSQGTIVRVAGSAVVPTQPIAPKKTINALLAAVAGLVVSIIVAFALEFSDPSIRSSEELARDLNLATFEIQTSDITQTKRTLKPGIPTPPQVLPVYYQIWAHLFLGSRPCGKTLLIANLGQEQDSGLVVASLGMIAAQTGQSVILVDSNVLCPSLDQIFGVPNTRGWSNMLGEEHPDIGSYLQPTSFKNLMVLSSGTSSLRSSEAIVSPRLASAIGGLREKADWVLFTSASPSSTVDALLMGKQVEEVLLMVATRETPRNTVLRFRDQLQKIGANILGVIVFQTKDRALKEFLHIVSPGRLKRTTDQLASPVSPGTPMGA